MRSVAANRVVRTKAIAATVGQFRSVSLQLLVRRGTLHRNVQTAFANTTISNETMMRLRITVGIRFNGIRYRSFQTYCARLKQDPPGNALVGKQRLMHRSLVRSKATAELRAKVEQVLKEGKRVLIVPLLLSYGVSSRASASVWKVWIFTMSGHHPNAPRFARLEQAKFAVLNTPTSKSGQRTYDPRVKRSTYSSVLENFSCRYRSADSDTSTATSNVGQHPLCGALPGICAGDQEAQWY